MCVRIEGDVSNGISCYLFRVSSLCPLVLPGFQNTQGSGRNQTVHHHRTLKEGGLREDGPLQPRASVILSGKKKKHPGDKGNIPNHSQIEYLTKLGFDFF